MSEDPTQMTSGDLEEFVNDCLNEALQVYVQELKNHDLVMSGSLGRGLKNVFRTFFINQMKDDPVATWMVSGDWVIAQTRRFARYTSRLVIKGDREVVTKADIDGGIETIQKNACTWGKSYLPEDTNPDSVEPVDPDVRILGGWCGS